AGAVRGVVCGGRGQSHYTVLPLDTRILYTILNPRPSRLRERTRYRYVPDGAPVPESVAGDTRNRSQHITVTVDVPEGVTPSGVLLAIGCVLGGWSLHVLDGRLLYVHTLYGKRLDVTATDAVIGAGRHTLGFAYERTTDDGGTTTLLRDGEV